MPKRGIVMREFINDYIGQFDEFAMALRAAQAYGDPFVIKSDSLGAEVELVGNTGHVVNFNWLDYLAMGNHPAVKEYAIKCLEKHGMGTISSRVLIDSMIHQELEKCLSDFKDSEACVIMPTGYSSTFAMVSLLANEMVAGKNRMRNKSKTFLFADKLSHACIQDAITPFKHGKHKKTESFIFNHLDYDGLYEMLKSSHNKEANRFIITDALFSMNGSFADVHTLLRLAKEFDSFIVLDNAHCDGIYGRQGKGILDMEHIGKADREYFFNVGTFSKAFASVGGYMTMPFSLCDLARVSQWPYIFSAALPTANVASLINVLSIIRSEDGDNRRKILLENSRSLLNGLRQEGFNTLNSSSHVIPIVIGNEKKCLEVQKYLVNEEKLMLGAARFPAAERGGALLRLTLTTEHSVEHAEKLTGGLKRARDKFKF